MERKGYKIELVQPVPESVNLSTMETIVYDRDWYGHSYGRPVGRVYQDGTIESFLDDLCNGNRKHFELLKESGVLRSRARHLMKQGSFKEYDCEEYYLMYRCVDHSSGSPTIINLNLDTCCNVAFKYTYEILLVADDEYKRYFNRTIETQGPFTHCLVDEMEQLREQFEEWIIMQENGLYQDESGTIYIDFYDDFGSCFKGCFEGIPALMMCVNSVRIVHLEREIFPLRGQTVGSTEPNREEREDTD